MKLKFWSSAAIASGVFLIGGNAIAHNHNEQEANYTVEELATGLNNPWGLAFLPNGDALITEKVGTLRRLSSSGELSEPISGLPKAVVKGQGGVLGLAVHPDFNQNQMVYVCLNVAGDGGAGSEVHAGRLKGNELVDTKAIFIALPKSSTGFHFGCRVTFDKNDDVFISLGDRGRPMEYAQHLDKHMGKVVKVSDDGSIPQGNPFIGQEGKDDIYTYGHRNVQGMTMHPETGEIWTHEHGPKGGDEINILNPGDNYGWPVISYGINYDGSILTDKTEMPGMRQPLKYWDPSIAPSGMDFYMGDMFEQWKGDLLIGSLKFRYLLRLELDENNAVIAEHKMLQDRNERIRDVVVGPDGSIYALVDDQRNGKLLKITAN